MFTKHPRLTISGFSAQRRSLTPSLSAAAQPPLRCDQYCLHIDRALLPYQHASWEISGPARSPLFGQEVIHLRLHVLLQAECDTA